VECPRVSVVIPAYQAARYVAQSVRSALEQTIGGVEVIVVNDGSPDVSQMEAVLEPFMPRIKYLTQKNGGPGSARNSGIRAARAPLVAFLDADDFWDPAFLSVQVRFLDERPDIALVYSDALQFSELTGVSRRFMDASPQRAEPGFLSLLAFECAIGTSTVVVRRDALLAVGSFDADIGNYSEDFDLYLRLAHAGYRFAWTDELLVYHRVHSGNLTAAPQQLPRGVLRVLRKWEAVHLPEGEAVVLQRSLASVEASLELDSGKVALATGDILAAREHFARVARLGSSSWKLAIVRSGLYIAPRTMQRVVNRWYAAQQVGLRRG
jgi:glycosyltransferase involved in cell wall biosynthesis